MTRIRPIAPTATADRQGMIAATSTSMGTGMIISMTRAISMTMSTVTHFGMAMRMDTPMT